MRQFKRYVMTPDLGTVINIPLENYKQGISAQGKDTREALEKAMYKMYDLIAELESLVIDIETNNFEYKD